MGISARNFRQLSPEEVSPFGNVLRDALAKFSGITNAAYLPQEKEADVRQKISEALIKQAESKYAPQMQEAKLNTERSYPQYYNAQSQNLLSEANKNNVMTPIEALKQNILNKFLPQKEESDVTKQNILNKFLPQREQAEIDETKQRGNYYQQGGGRGSAGDKQELFFQSLVGKDNPQLNGDPDKIYEASNVLRNGGVSLSDGTKLNPLSAASTSSFNRLLKGGTTAQAINQSLQANQASVGLPIFNKYIKEGIEDTGYGDTTFGYSGKQIKDSLDTGNPAAQERIGKYIAAQQLLYDRAALMLKVNALPPGQKLASKIAELAAQSIKAQYPKLSAEARQIGADRVAQALQEELEARNKYGINISKMVTQNPEKASSSDQNTQQPRGKVRNYNLQTGQFE